MVRKDGKREKLMEKRRGNEKKVLTRKWKLRNEEIVRRVLVRGKLSKKSKGRRGIQVRR